MKGIYMQFLAFDAPRKAKASECKSRDIYVKPEVTSSYNVVFLSRSFVSPTGGDATPKRSAGKPPMRSGFPQRQVNLATPETIGGLYTHKTRYGIGLADTFTCSRIAEAERSVIAFGSLNISVGFVARLLPSDFR